MKPLALAAVLAAAASVASAARSSQNPEDGLAIALVLDVSVSVSQEPPRLDDRFVRIFNAFEQKLQPGDRGAVGVLANHVHLSALTSDRRELSNSVRLLLQVPDVDRLGPTPIWDALAEAIALVADGRGRPIIILYSDGRSSGNVHGLAEVIARATRARAAIHVVLAPQKLPVEHLNPGDLIEQLTSATGGQRLMEPRPPGNAAAVVSQLMDTLRGR